MKEALHPNPNSSDPQDERASDRLALHLVRSVFQGEVKPGERLPPENELASHHGVARGTVREAMRSLEEMKVVHSRRGSGVTALDFREHAGLGFAEALLRAEPDTAMLMEILAFRDLLAPTIARVLALALSRIGMSDVMVLEAIDRQELAALDGGDIGKAIALEEAYRRHLIGLSGNLLIQLHENSIRPVLRHIVRLQLGAGRRQDHIALRQNLVRKAAVHKHEPSFYEPMLLQLFNQQSHDLRRLVLATENPSTAGMELSPAEPA